MVKFAYKSEEITLLGQVLLASLPWLESFAIASATGPPTEEMYSKLREVDEEDRKYLEAVRQPAAKSAVSQNLVSVKRIRDSAFVVPAEAAGPDVEEAGADTSATEDPLSERCSSDETICFLRTPP